MTDYLKKYKSLFSTTLASGIGTGTGDTLTLSSVTGLPTDAQITITIDRVDSEGNPTPTKLERITGTISGSNLTSYTRGVDETTEQAHSAGAVVEMIFNAEDWNDMVDWGLVEHDQDGTHTSGLVTTLKATGAEINTGTEDAKIVTPKAIADSAIPSATSTTTFTNKRITKRVLTITSDATPTVNTDDYDVVSITALATNITSMSTNLSGTPTNFQSLIYRILDNGTARTITWGSSFQAMGADLPTTTTANKVLTVGFLYDTVDAKWGCIASVTES